MAETITYKGHKWQALELQHNKLASLFRPGGYTSIFYMQSTDKDKEKQSETGNYY